jgi:hypothetical protein
MRSSRRRLPRPWAFTPVLLWLMSLAGCGLAQGPADPERSVQGAAGATPMTRTMAAFPLRTEPGKRYLIDAEGRPFLLHGDTAWSLIVQLRREEVDRYLEDRRAHGVNAILVNLIERHFSRDPPNNAYGEPPFLTPGDFSTPNEAYFAHAEYVIARARENGMLVLLAPAYMGFGGGDEGWYEEMKANGAARLRAYGSYVADRFRHYDNIVWVQGGDFNPPEKVLVRALADGIRSVTPGALQTFHGSRLTAALEFLDDPWLNVNDIYCDENSVVEDSLRERARSTMPFFLIEARYEDDPARDVDAATTRAYAYQAVLAGATGHVFGNDPIWFYGEGWIDALGRPGIRSLAWMRDLLESFPWWTLQPDTASALLTMGTGTGASRAVAAQTDDRAIALVYLPTSRPIVIDLSRLAGPRIRARWFDPSSGAYATVAGSPFEGNGSRLFVPAGKNSAGHPDWVLVLESLE